VKGTYSPEQSSAHPLDIGLVALAARLRDREISATQVVEAVALRVVERNGGEPSFDGRADAVNAWDGLDLERALRSARRLDGLLASGAEAPALAGIPIGVKSLIAVAGRPLTASSRVREGVDAGADSAAWAALRAAGAICVGHTHSHEFAAGGSTDQVGNPWDLRVSAGGSSGGSAAAVAAGMLPAALGTDTAGSLRIPAAMTGASTFKATYGRVAVDGVIPLAPSFDHVGPIARTIEDCAVLMSVLTEGPRARDPWGIAGRPPIRWTRRVGLHGLRIAVSNRTDGVAMDPDVQAGLDRARAAVQSLGAEVVMVSAAPDLPRADYDTILRAEARAYHARYAAQIERYRPSTREFVAPEAELISAADYLAAQSRRIAVTAGWQDWFSVHRVDALLEPTSALLPAVRGRGYDAGRVIGGENPYTRFTATWNVTGFPVAAFPVSLGDEAGLPVGVSLIARADDDERLLAIADAVQRELPPPVLRDVYEASPAYAARSKSRTEVTASSSKNGSIWAAHTAARPDVRSTQ
jgi:aspartyl-tRNA(Asn)/glutamyl-tRNA(Gln) amidotransferase subunit A